MDRRPLLSSNRESSRRPPPQPLLPPSQVDASLIVFEDDVGEAPNGASAGRSSEARTSIFSRLSFSAWSDSSLAAPRGGASAPPYIIAALLRPFQRLGFWWTEGERCRCWPACWSSCWCWRRSSSSPTGFRHSGNDEFDGEGNEIVAADALRASGASRGSQRSKSGGTPTTAPHGGGSGRQHRQYAPPRSRSTEEGMGQLDSPALTPLMGAAGAEHDAAEAQQGDSVTGSSFAGSSTPPSSVAQSRVATAPGEHLVMQRGVLMRITADGTCTRVEETATSQAGRGGQHAGHEQRYSPQTSSLEEGQRGTQAAARLAPAVGTQRLQLDAATSLQDKAAEEAQNSYATAMAMDVLEASRQSLRTLDHLSSALIHFAPYLPLRVETEVDLNSSSALPAVTSHSSGASPTTPASPALPLCVHVLGPVQSCPTAVALRILEDVLLEDCDHSKICISALHCADLDLRGVTVGNDEASSLAGRSSSLAGPGEGRLRMQSNAFLDLLVSPTSKDARRSAEAVARDGATNGSSNTAALTAAAASSHVLAFLDTIVKGRGPQLTTLHFTRCFVAPHDLARFVPLPLRTVRRLRYEHCALTPAHIDALLTHARHQDAERRDAELGSGGKRTAAFGALEELQLSGPLTPECISELLDYIEEQQLYVTAGSGSSVALHQLILPTTLVRAAKEHPFLQANYQRMSVVSAQ